MPIPKGTRDFLPSQVIKRNFIFNTIREVFELFGFQPIETPCIENNETLLGKYGEEGDKLIFKILNSGDFLEGVNNIKLSSNELSLKITEKSLRYDLTVPFARFIVDNQNNIEIPFKRYQIQPVWRSDRPQKGRYREFYQCDVDIVGCNDLNSDAELIAIANLVFNNLGIKNAKLLYNNRKILNAFCNSLGINNNLIPFTIAIDKLHKIGENGVIDELKKLNLSDLVLNNVKILLNINGTNEEKIEKMTSLLKESQYSLDAINEIKLLFEKIKNYDLKSLEIEFTPHLARGLNYYTGSIFEVQHTSFGKSSIAGGGRYDNLTELFGKKGFPGVGLSFGADRIYDLMESLNLFPQNNLNICDIFVVQLKENDFKNNITICNNLRDNKLKVDLFPTADNLSKQLKYANKRNIKWVIICSEAEIKKGVYLLKNMTTFKQDEFNNLNDLVNHIKTN